MFHDVPSYSKILEGYRKLTPSGFRPLNPEMQDIIAEADKPKKRGKGENKVEKKTTDKERPYETVKPPTKRKAPTGALAAASKRRK